MWCLAMVAALLLVPLAPLLASGEQDVLSSSALITVNVPLTGGEVEGVVYDLNLRVDVQDSPEPCAPAAFQIDGHTLSQDAISSGRGDLVDSNGDAFTASWAFTCVEKEGQPWDQVLRLTIDSVNGHQTPGVSIETSFRQTAPAAIIGVFGAESARLLPSSSDSTGAMSSEPEVDEMQSLMTEVAELWGQISSLEVRLRDKEQALAAMLSTSRHRYQSHAPQSRLQLCNSVRCMVNSFASKLKVKAGDLYRGMFGAHGGHVEHTHGGNYSQSFINQEVSALCAAYSGRPAAEKPSQISQYTAHPTSSTDSEAFVSSGNTAEQSPSPCEGECPDPDGDGSETHDTFFLTLCIAAAAFALISLCSLLIARCRARNAAEPELSWLARIQARRARRKRRSRAVRSFFCSLFSNRMYREFSWAVFCRLFGGEENRETRQPMSQEQGRPRREEARSRSRSNSTSTGSDVSASLEEDIARFREAIGMVDDIIAAEEGRSRGSRPAPPPPLPRPEPAMAPGAVLPRIPPSTAAVAYPGYLTMDYDSPPAYQTDEDSEDESSHMAGVVADGFRYSPFEADDHDSDFAAGFVADGFQYSPERRSSSAETDARARLLRDLDSRSRTGGLPRGLSNSDRLGYNK